MDRKSAEVIKNITQDVYKRHEKQFMKTEDVFAQERAALSKSKDPRLQEIVRSREMNKKRDIVDEKVEKKMDKELTHELNKAIKQGLIDPKSVKQYRR